MYTYTQSLLKSLAVSLAIVFSVSACSSTLAPEDDATTEYVFEQSNNDEVLAKDHKTKNQDRSDD